MTRGSIFTLVNVSLIAGLVFAVTDVIAQQQPTTSTGGPALVSTACGAGQLTVCGTEPVAEHCTYVFGVNVSKVGGTFGFNFGGMQCTGGGTQNRYKDYDPNRATGTCIVTRRPPADATGTGREEDGEWIEEESC